MEKIKSRRIIFVLLLLTIFSFIPLRSLKFEFNIEKLFPRDDDDLCFLPGISATVSFGKR
jgi:predicted RND superfamily exporter protein